VKRSLGRFRFSTKDRFARDASGYILFEAKRISSVLRNARFWGKTEGNVGPIMALMLVPIIGALGMAAEGSYWWLTQRAAQNAADTAAMSASWNGGDTAAGSGSASSYSTTGCSTTPGAFDCEAVGAASRAGFVNGDGKVVVYPQYLTDATTPACPFSLTTCYKVTVTRTLPVYLVGLVLGGRTTQNVQAVAYASLVYSKKAPDCMFGLAKTGGTGLTANGASKANMGGCDIQIGSINPATGLPYPDAAATCNGGGPSGNNLQADAVFATGTNTKCGNTKVSNAAAVADPYASLAGNIPADRCGGTPDKYPQEPQKKTDPALPASNIIGNGSGVGKNPSPTVAQITWGNTQTFCGDVQLNSPIKIESNTTLIIYNGGLDLNNQADPSIPVTPTSIGAAIQTDANASLTIIFAGSNTVTSSDGTTTITPNHIFANGFLDFSAPPSGSGTWSGIAIYQAPNLTTNIDINNAGNGPLFNLTGVVYQPNANDTLSGIVGKSTNGLACFVWVFNSMTINGTGKMFQGSQSQCSQAGVTQVFSSTPVHELIQ
jgi:Flp pilus assembly protein TadG